MAYDESFADRIRQALSHRDDIIEKKMFGGIAFMLSGNMCIGVNGERLMARVGPSRYEEALSRPHAGQMDFTGKPLKGFVYVEPAGFATASALAGWLDTCIEFAASLPAK